MGIGTVSGKKRRIFSREGSSHGGVVGWATGVTNLAREWTAALCRHAQGLDESEVLALVWRMFGVEDLALPETAAGVAEGPLPIAALYEREVARLKAQTSGAVPLYPPLSAGASPELVRALGEAVAGHGCGRVFVYGQCRGRGSGASVGGGFGGRGVS